MCLFFSTPQEFIDLHIQCEDGVLAAHRLVLAACSPFIRSLILDLGGEATSDPVLLLLPDVKMNLVQTLLQLLYAGQVTAQEGQFYSLMKLVLDLDVSASIEAEKTNAAPTKFETMPVAAGGSGECAYGEGMRPRKRSRIDTFDSLIMEGSHSVQQQQQSRITGSVTFQHEEGGLQQMWQKPGGLVVNSLTASGVEVKQEPEEDNSNSSSMDHHHHLTDRKGGNNNSSSSGSFQSVVQASYALAPSSTNSANNNNSSSQLGHFVSVSPGYQVSV